MKYQIDQSQATTPRSSGALGSASHSNRSPIDSHLIVIIGRIKRAGGINPPIESGVLPPGRVFRRAEAPVW
jgi:hypothetical protein